jgi:hypothetical protein
MKSYELGGTQDQPSLAGFERPLDIDYDVVDLPDWFKEPGEEYGYRPWQHTPLRPYDEPVRAHQRALYAAFERLATEPVPPDTHPGIARLVHLDFMTGNARRQTECQANFETWRVEHANEHEKLGHDDELKWLLGEAKAGHASPASLLRLLEHAPSLPSLDLQVLTTPFGYRRHNVPAMRAELKDDVEAIGGELYDVPIATHAPRVAVHRLDRDAPEDKSELGLMATQKHLIGSYSCGADGKDDIYIMQRDAYVVRADADSGFSGEIIKLLRTVPDKDPRFKQIQDYVGQRIEKSQGIIPTSTMVYAFRKVERPAAERAEYMHEIEEARREAAMAKLAIKQTNS